MKHIIQFLLLVSMLLSGCSSSGLISKDIEEAKKDVYRVLAAPYCADGIVYIDPQLTSYTLAVCRSN
jgi:predicted small secreted protein